MLPSGLAALPLEVEGTCRKPRNEAMELRRWKDDSNPYYLPRPLVRDKLPARRGSPSVRRGRAEIPVHLSR
jgi:hypothetical protein